MKNRNLVAVFALPIVTFGIYGIVWLVKTKDEMNRLGAQIPTAWLLIIPFVNFYWFWKYSEGVDHVTNGKMSAALAFILEIFLGNIGNTILQSEFNKLADAPVAAAVPGEVPQYQAPVVPVAGDTASVPTTGFTTSPSQTFPTSISSEVSAEIAPQPVTLPEYTNDAPIEQPIIAQPVAAPSVDVIADVIPQPDTTTVPENNSPSSPTPTM